ncbi:MAG: FtsX-like permease family protein [Anaerolineae bacterium]|nr:FtsX-like permease family protein [Anaerolineae bacterium]
MIGSRWKKVWADFWSNRGRTLLTIVTIAVGAFAVGFNSNLGLYMNESMDVDYLSANPSEAEVYAYPLNDDMVKKAKEIPGVDTVEGFSNTNARILLADGSYANIIFTAVDDPSTLTLNTLKPALDGTSIPTYGEKETILDASASSLGYEPGDTLVIELANGKKREIKLGGYMHAVTGFPYNLAQQVNAYVTKDTLEWLGGDIENYGQLSISVSEKQTDAEHVTTVAQAVADELKRAGATVYFVSVYQPGHHFAYSITQGVFFVLNVLGYLTVLLSGFLIVNTITALMTQHTRQIGIMKATGGSTMQIFGMYLVLILAFGVGSLLLAVPLANAVAKTIGGGMAQWLNFHAAPYQGYSSTLIQQVLVALVVPVLAAILPIYNSVKITVREALSDYGLGGNAKPKDDSVNKSSVLIPRPIRISLRNTFRRKTRLGLTLFTLVLGGAVFIAVYNLWESFDQVIEDIQGYFLADINISFDRGYRYDKVANIAMSIPGVEGAEGWLEYTGTLQSDEEEAGTQILFVAPPSTSILIDPIITSGRWLQPGDENAIVIGNHLLQIFPDLKVGDTLTIEIDGKDTIWHIVGTYSITGNVSPPLLYVNYEYLSVLVGQPEMAYSLRVVTSQHDSLTQNRINDQLQAAFEERGIQIQSTQLGADFIRDQKAQTDVLVYFMLVMASLIAFVGGLGLMGTMSINVLERTREIGVMRAIGASNGDIQSIVITEGMVIGILSWAISILIAIPITNVLCFGVGMAILTAPMPPIYGSAGVLAWLIFTIVLGTLASAIPARRASSLTVRDTLAYE